MVTLWLGRSGGMVKFFAQLQKFSLNTYPSAIGSGKKCSISFNKSKAAGE